jgi:hypothetical protein
MDKKCIFAWATSVFHQNYFAIGNVVSRLHILLDPRIVGRPPWTGSHNGGAARRRRAHRRSEAHELGGGGGENAGERENGEVSEGNGGGDSAVVGAAF